MPEPLPALPEVLAGPILRRLQAQRLIIWPVSSRRLKLQLQLYPQGSSARLEDLPQHCQILQIGKHAFI